ncbi:hypothetical protein AAKU55_002292 [Oxalobacteraceae bacterium GrIS 1.11]
MVQAEMMPFLRIVEQIKQWCAQRRSGTVFMVSDDNRMAQVQLDNGEIASLLCRNRRGLDALAIIRGMAHARLRFDEAYVNQGDRDNLSTQAIFDYLYDVAMNTLASDKPAPAVGAPLAGPAAEVTLTADVRATFERVLMKYIGPMAEIVCEDYFDQAKDMRSLVQALASEVPAPEQAAKFRAEIIAELSLKL